jgi:predicted glycosyltransferase
VKNFLRIMVCPLDWGIGHATRCVPIIRMLREQKHEVIIAADGAPFNFLKGIFPDFEIVRLPGKRISYPRGKNMILKMMLQSPAIIWNIFREHQRIKKIARKYKADVIISDNRFGLWTKDVYSIYMTHQVMIKIPERMNWLEPLLYRIHNWFIKHYDECWIPDFPNEPNLSGDLSHKYPIPKNAKFIGLLSRFTANRQPPTANFSISPDLLVLLSGPEPQRTIFEKIILNELQQHRGLHAVILQGLPGELSESFPIPGVAVLSHLPDSEISDLIKSARLIICRSGYSTLMDLATLGRGAILVPTPGQTEQEYLARRAAESGSFYAMEQNGFNLGLALEKGKYLKSPEFPPDISRIPNFGADLKLN